MTATPVEQVIAMKRTACILNLFLFVTPGFLLTASGSERGPAEPPSREAKAAPATRPVFLAGNLSAEDLVALTANVAAASEQGTVLLDFPGNRRYLKDFLAADRPSELFLVGSFSEEAGELERALGVKPSAVESWSEPVPAALWKRLFPRAERVVVCAAQPRRLLLQAACLAGTMRAPLFVLKGRREEAAELRRQLGSWRSRMVHAVGESALRVCRGWTNGEVRALPDQKAVADLTLRLQAEQGPVQTLVVANPADSSPKSVGMSTFAPWVAVRRRAALLLTGDKGDDAAALVRKALEDPKLRQAEHLIVVADPRAIPPERRPNPLPGKDE